MLSKNGFGIRDPGSEIWDPEKTWVKKALDPGSGFATPVCGVQSTNYKEYTFRCRWWSVWERDGTARCGAATGGARTLPSRYSPVETRNPGSGSRTSTRRSCSGGYYSIILSLLWILIRIRMNPHCLTLQDPSAGCSLLRAEGFSCSLDVLYRGLGISK